MNWFEIIDVNKIDTPALIIYSDRVEDNIKTAIEMIVDVTKLRPHIKTHKSREVCLLLMKHGVKKFKCATIAEAEVLGMVGANDVLLAYQLVGPKMGRFVELLKKYPNSKFSCLIDNKVSLLELNEIALRENLVIDIYLDVNVGMNRTGVSDFTETVELYYFCKNLVNVSCIGLHAYDGHIHTKEINQRTVECERAYSLVTKIKEKIDQECNISLKVVVGGTPTFPIHLKRDHVECSPGTFVFWDEGYGSAFEEQKFVPAAIILTRVISLPTPTTLCLDLGHKSIAAEKELSNRFKILNHENLKLISQSEEHVVVETGKNHSHKIGDVFYCVPRHICPTVALYESASIILHHKLISQWEITARDRKIVI